MTDKPTSVADLDMRDQHRITDKEIAGCTVLQMIAMGAPADSATPESSLNSDSRGSEQDRTKNAQAGASTSETLIQATPLDERHIVANCPNCGVNFPQKLPRQPKPLRDTQVYPATLD